jgi:dTDP-glucose pyrophosphorylase
MNQKNDFWREATSPNSAKIKDVINLLDKVALKLVLITDKSNSLIGTISDGDVRRGLLRGLELNDSIESIINKIPTVVSLEINRKTVLDLMVTNKVQQIPIINEKNQVIGLHLWDELNVPVIYPNIMVIMAGGKGTRLHPHTKNCPKPLLPIAGKPILEHIINRAKNQGFTNFVLAIHYLGHMIEDYFGDGDRFGVKIQYLRENSPLGTAGALSLLNPEPDSSFIITNGDVVTDINYVELLNFHQQNSASATIAVRGHEWQNPFGVVKTQGIELIGFEEKPVTRSHVNAGIYVLEPWTLSLLEKSVQLDMPTLLERLREKSKRVIAFPVHESWLDVGRLEDFNKLSINPKVGFDD